jgi:hypothetical protein
MAALLVHCGKRPGSPETSRFRSPAQQLNVKNGDWFPSRRRDRNSDRRPQVDAKRPPASAGGFLPGAICTRYSQAARRCRRCQEIWRRYGASISGAHRRIKSANFADLVSGLKRLRSVPRAASRPIAADVQASGLPHPLLSGRRTSRTSQHFRKPSAVWSSLA